MAALETKEREQLITFLKYFALKSTQVIIQSRNGIKIMPRGKSFDNSRDHKRHDFFNLAIPDNDHVTILTKNVLKGETEVALKQILCIDINLKFPEGNEFLLETWSLELSSERDLKLLCPMTEVHHRMGTLLKSLLTISRMQPAYKLARKQGDEPYTLTYRVFCGDPLLDRLGTQTKTINMNGLVLPLGTIKLSVTYKTDLTMDQNKKSNEIKKHDIIVKSDHFKESPRKEHMERKVPDLSKPLSAGAFVDTVKIEELHKALQETLPPEPPMAWLLSQITDSPEKIEKENKLSKKSGEGAASSQSAGANQSKAIEVPIAKKVADDLAYHKKLEFPFSDGSPITELANFYHECMTARSQTDEWCDVAEEMKKMSTDNESLNNQFKAFQDAIPEFDSMIASMFSNNSDNNES